MRLLLSSDALEASIDVKGSELVSLRAKPDRDLLWAGGGSWSRRAPILFPVIGKLTDGTLRSRGRQHPIGQHGFARDLVFEVLESEPAHASLLLKSTPETLRAYPFHFTLRTDWMLEGPELSLTFVLSNTGEEQMPASLGWHPGFISDDAPGWSLEFEAPEHGPIRRASAATQLQPWLLPSPASGRTLDLTDDLFQEGAVIFEDPKSRKVSYVSPAGPVFELAFPDFPHLAVWKKPGEPFVCLEPWNGLPPPAGFDQDIADMPHQMHLPPGASKTLACRITVLADAEG